MNAIFAIAWSILITCQDQKPTKPIPGDDKPRYPRSSLLVEPLELARTMHKVVLLDARPLEDYERGHIPGAYWVDAAEWKQAMDKGETEEAWSRRIGQLGIDGAKPVVIYDDSAGKSAAHIRWILRYWGVGDVRLLNGFLTGWKSHKEEWGLDLDKVPSLPKRVKYAATRQPALFADKQSVLAALPVETSQIQIVDARSKEEFEGSRKGKNLRGGHVPGARNLNWELLVDTQGTQRFRTADEIRRLMDEAGIDPAKQSIVYCQSGDRASVMHFALELMGGNEIANYYASFEEWSKNELLPLEARQP